MIKQETDVIAKYFDSCVFKPTTMMEALTVPWPENVEELIFASHSSIITKKLLMKELDLQEPEEDNKEEEEEDEEEENQEITENGVASKVSLANSAANLYAYMGRI